MAEKVDLQAMVYTLAADIRDSKAKMAEASADVKRRMGEIERSVAKPVKVQAIKDLNGEMGLGANLAGKLGGAIGGIVTAGTVAAFVALKQAMTMADEIGDTATQLQVTTGVLQEYRYAAVKAGGATDDADAALGSFTEKLGEAQSGSKAAADSFKRLGFTESDIKSFKSVDEALTAVVGRVGELSSASERAAISKKLGIEKLIPVINAGEGALAKFREEARRVGYVLSDDVIKKLSEAEDRSAILAQVIQAQLAVAFADLAPVIMGSMEMLSGFIGKMNEMSNAVDQFTRKQREAFDRQPKWVQDYIRFVGRQNEGSEAFVKGVYGVDPYGSGKTRGRRQMGAERQRDWERRAAEAEQGGGTGRLATLPSGGGGRGGSRRTGPTPEELARQKELAQIEWDIEQARASGLATRIREAETARWLFQREKELHDQGMTWQAAEIQAMLDKTKLNNLEIEQAERLAGVRADNIDTDPSISPSALEQFNQDWLAMSEEHEARYRDIIGGAFDALRNGGLEGFFQYFAQRLGDNALEALIDATTKAALAAEASGGSGGGINWGSLVSTGLKFFASPGTLNPGQTGIAGEAGPERFYAKPGGGVEFAGANRVRSFGMPSMPQAVARGGTTVIQYIQADQSILTPDIFSAIRETGLAAGEYGATMGAARGSAASARGQARRQMRTIPR